MGDFNPFGVFIQNMKIANLDDVVTVKYMSSERALAHFSDGSLDMVFIDSDHMYLSVLTDIIGWWPKLKTGGLFIGHDAEFYYNEKPDRVKILDKECLGRCHPGVIAALFDVFNDYHSLSPKDWIWWIKKQHLPCKIPSSVDYVIGGTNNAKNKLPQKE